MRDAIQAHYNRAGTYFSSLTPEHCSLVSAIATRTAGSQYPGVLDIAAREAPKVMSSALAPEALVGLARRVLGAEDVVDAMACLLGRL
jgi:hypothetical protein